MRTTKQQIEFVGGPFDGDILAVQSDHVVEAAVVAFPAHQNKPSVPGDTEATASRYLAYYELQQHDDKCWYRYWGTTTNPKYEPPQGSPFARMLRRFLGCRLSAFRRLRSRLQPSPEGPDDAGNPAHERSSQCQ